MRFQCAYIVFAVLLLFGTLLGDTIEKCTIPTLENGSARITLGIIISYECSSGYELIGERHSLCDSGRWITPVPSCVGITIEGCSHPGDPLNGHVFSLDGWSSAHLICDDGYEEVGSITTYCVGGNWKPELGKCNVSQATENPQITCNYPGARLYGEVASFDGWLTANLICDEDFVLTGWSTTYCEDGNWNQPLGDCLKSKPRELKCSYPGDRLNGEVDTIDGWLTAELICDDSFKLTGWNTTYCVDESWTHQLGECIEIQPTRNPIAGCRPPGDRLNGNVTSFDDWSTSTLICDNGYVVAGSIVIHCLGDIWNQTLGDCIQSQPEDFPKTSCDFEIDMCGWSKNERFDRESSNYSSSDLIGNGTFMISKHFKGGDGRLVSPLYSVDFNMAYCLQFSLFMEYSNAKLLIRLERDSGSMNVVFVRYGNSKPKWSNEFVRIFDQPESFRIAILTMGSEDHSRIGIDNVTLLNGDDCITSKL